MQQVQHERRVLSPVRAHDNKAKALRRQDSFEAKFTYMHMVNLPGGEAVPLGLREGDSELWAVPVVLGLPSTPGGRLVVRLAKGCDGDTAACFSVAFSKSTRLAGVGASPACCSALFTGAAATLVVGRSSAAAAAPPARHDMRTIGDPLPGM